MREQISKPNAFLGLLLAILLTALYLESVFAWEYIWMNRGDFRGARFGGEYICGVGDQNRDGYDDILETFEKRFTCKIGIDFECHYRH